MDLSAVTVLCALGATASNEIRVDCATTGTLRVRLGDQTLLTGGLVCHGVQWQGVGQDEAKDVARTAGGRFRGAMPMPKGNEGRLRFEQVAKRTGDLTAVDYTVTFERDNDIKEQGILLRLPADAFAGKRITFYPAEAEITLPREPSTHRSEHYGWAFAVQLDRDRVLLVRTTRGTMLSLMDFRQWAGQGFGVGVRMVGEGKIPAGATARGRITLAVVSSAEARRVSCRWRPDFDRSRASILLDANGRVWLRDRQRDYASAAIEIQGIHWAYSAQDERVGWDEGGGDRRVAIGTIPVRGPGGTAVQFRQSARSTAGGIDLRYELSFPRDCRLNAYQVTWSLRAEAFLEQQIILTERRPTTTAASTSRRALTIAAKRPDKPEIGTFVVSRVAVAPGHPLGFALAFDRPTPLRIEDRRAEGSPMYDLRVQFARDEKGTLIKAGTSVECGVAVRPNRPHQVVLNDAAYAHRTDTSGWVAFTPPWHTSAVDLSFLNVGPAGRHGFLQVRGGEFVFADGTPARFWGTNFTAEQNLPPHDDAEITARRLARYGVNMVRVHQADAGYAADNLFRSNRRRNGTRRLDPTMMDRLDYLIAQLKRNGIYVYFDLLSTRTFDASDGVASADQLALGGKPYTNFDEHLIHLQEEFARQFLTHVNPYTRLAYKDDPAIAMIALGNENDVFSREIKIEPYRSRFEARYRAWAGLREVDLPDDRVDLRHRTPWLMRFLVEVQQAYNERMVRFVRSLGVRVPITTSNWTTNAGLVAASGPADFADSHAYWDHCWDKYTRIRNRMMVRSRRTVFGRLAFQRVPGKPFFCSEWGQPWPNEFRAEMPLAVASISALQGWGGALIYTYAHYSNPEVDCLSGPFDTLNDPCLFGLFPHAALIVRRSDVERARERLAARIPDEKVYNKKPASPARCEAYDVAAERSMLATALADQTAKGWRDVPCDESILSPTAHSIGSDTGQYRRDWRDGVATIDTPGTQAVWGFVGGLDGPVELEDVKFEIGTPFSAVAVSSLTDEPIRSSDRLLLTAVGRAENTGMVYDLFHTRKIAAGRGPILIEPVCGRVSVRTLQSGLRVRAIGPSGDPLGTVGSELSDGRLRFEIGPKARTMYYLIEP